MGVCNEPIKKERNEKVKVKFSEQINNKNSAFQRQNFRRTSKKRRTISK